MLDFIFYLLTGAIAGTLSGLLGIGGGVIIVPVLIMLLPGVGMPAEYVVQVAVATALASIIVSSLSAVNKHFYRGSIDFILLRRLLLPIMIGVIIGSSVSHYISGATLKIIIACVMSFMAIRMLFLRNLSSKYRIAKPVVIGASTLLSAISAMVGAGGGVFFVPFLLYCGYPMARVLSTASVITFIVALISTLAYLLIGFHHVNVAWTTSYIYWPAFFGIILTSTFTARLGVVLAHRLPVNVIRYIFAMLLLMVAVKMVI